MINLCRYCNNKFKASRSDTQCCSKLCKSRLRWSLNKESIKERRKKYWAEETK